jgi:hypothetical protein
MPVFAVSYIPTTDGITVDPIPDIAPGTTVAHIRQVIAQILQPQAIATLAKGTTYHGYKNYRATPYLHYRVIATKEYLTHIPEDPITGTVDYNKIMTDINIQHYVEDLGVKEVWIWAYHHYNTINPSNYGFWESNMSSPYGDVSNSDCNPNDMPVLAKTYIVYYYNYGRGPSEATEDHMHQHEAMFRHIDNTLFWTKFVGATLEGRCGWSHYPPNGTSDYDWANQSYIMTDIEDWKPDGGSQLSINCNKWQADSLKWFIYWMQNTPGKDNGITYNVDGFDKPLYNWWIFVADWDYCKANNLKLWKEDGVVERRNCPIKGTLALHTTHDAKRTTPDAQR